MVDVLDIEAMRHWEETPIPTGDDPKRFALWNQIRSDLAAALDRIEELEGGKR